MWGDHWLADKAREPGVLLGGPRAQPMTQVGPGKGVYVFLHEYTKDWPRDLMLSL